MQHGNTALPATVIGLGSMGFGMAKSLRRAGLAVTGFDVAAASLERFAAAGGQVAATPAAAAKGAEIVVSVVVNAAQTEEILFGADGVAAAMSPTGVFISCATMSPTTQNRWPHGYRRAAGSISTRRSAAVPPAPARASSPSSPPAPRLPSPRPARRSMRWRQKSTSSAPSRGSAPRSK